MNQTHFLEIATISMVLVTLTAISGCQSVANVAQSVADTARGKEEQKPTLQTGTAAPSASTTATPTITQTAGSTSGQAAAVPAGEPCAANFAVSGGFTSGKQFKTQAPVASVAPDQAYRKAHAAVVGQGWQVTATDKDLRSISAVQQVVSTRAGKVVPMNVTIQPGKGSGSVVVLNFATNPGQVATEDAVRESFCKLVREIAS